MAMPNGDLQGKIKEELKKIENGNNSTEVEIRKVSWDDVYYGPKLKREIESIIDYLRDPAPFGEDMGYSGILFSGSPGTGKTLAALLIANCSSAKPFMINTLPSKPEVYIRKVFEEARASAPAIILLNECEKYFTKRSDLGDISDIRVVDQFLAEMDGAISNKGVVVIADTNRVESIDPALRRPGRFDKEVVFGAPDENGRKKIIDIHLKKDHIYRINEKDIEELIENSLGYTGGDMKGLLKEAFVNAHRTVTLGLKKKYGEDWIKSREWEKIKKEGIVVEKGDLEKAMAVVYPSALRSFFFKKAARGFSNIGGYEDIKRQLTMNIVLPMQNQALFSKYGRDGANGILLYGPPRTGKTSLAEAVARESKANLMVIRGPEIFNPLFGKSEEIVREIKKRAVESAPSIIVFDEADSIASKRGRRHDNITDSITGQILSEFSPVPAGVYLILTTNMPEKIDEALLSAGRIEKHIYVGPPEEKDREAILQVYFSKIKPAPKLDYKLLAKQTDGFTGAHIESLYRNVTDYLIMKEICSERCTIDTKLVIERIPKEKPGFDATYWQNIKQMFGG